MKHRMNVLDSAGAIMTGYEETLNGTRDECIADYERFLADSGVEFPHGVDAVEVCENSPEKEDHI
jgi:hypothetical protein